MGIAEKVDVSLTIFDAIRNALTIAGMSEDTANKYSTFAVEMYEYIKARPELQGALEGTKAVYDGAKGAKGYLAATRLMNNASQMQFAAQAEKFASKGKVSAGGAISAFVDYFAGLAKASHIEVNECAIAVTKVMLDVLTTIALAETVVGVWAAALQALAVGADTRGMIDACFNNN